MHPPSQRVLPLPRPLPSLLAHRKAPSTWAPWVVPPLHRPGSDRGIRILGPGNIVLHGRREAPDLVSLRAMDRGRGKPLRPPAHRTPDPTRHPACGSFPTRCFHGLPLPHGTAAVPRHVPRPPPRKTPELMSSAMNRASAFQFLTHQHQPNIPTQTQTQRQRGSFIH